MKQILIIVFIIFVVFPRMNAQFSIDISGGLNVSTSKYTQEHFIETSPRLAPYFGVTPKAKVNERLLILMDFQYSQKGYNQKFLLFGNESTIRFGYLNILPGVELRINDFLSVGCGAYYSLLLRIDAKDVSSDWNNITDSQAYKTTDFGWFGALKGSYKDFFLSFRYEYGISDVSEFVYTDEQGVPLPEVKLQNRNFQLGLGYRFHSEK